MEKYPAGQIEANGVTIPIFVTNHGTWEAEYDGRTQSYDTRDKLETRLKTLTKRAAVRVEIPVISIEEKSFGVTATRATVTGIHGANGNILVTKHYGGRRGDSKEQVSTTYISQIGTWFGGDVTDEQIAEFGALLRAQYEARNAVEDMRKRLGINLVKTTERVVKERSGSDGE